MSQNIGELTAGPARRKQFPKRMIQVSFLVFLALAAFRVESCKNGDLRPYPYTCRSYLECVGGGYVKKDCPVVKPHWDTATNSCAFWKYECGNVDCVEESKVEDPEAFGSGYLLCENGTEKKVACEAEKRFDPRCKHCTDDFHCLDGRRVYRTCKNFEECVNNAWVPKQCPLAQKMDEYTLNCMLWGAHCSDV